jgi:hypothetical protein
MFVLFLHVLQCPLYLVTPPLYALLQTGCDVMWLLWLWLWRGLSGTVSMTSIARVGFGRVVRRRRPKRAERVKTLGRCGRVKRCPVLAVYRCVVCSRVERMRSCTVYGLVREGLVVCERARRSNRE